MNNFYIVCFATENTPYVEIMKDKLQKSLDKLNLKYSIDIVPNQRNWYLNTAYKSKYIIDKLNQLNSDVVWIDADATVEREPKLFYEIPEEYDIAFHYLSWNLWYGHQARRDVKELLTGTMFFRNRQIVKDLCKEWHEEAVRTKEWEQKVLARVIKNYNLNIYELPLEYIYIDTLPNGQKPKIKLNPVIRHYQASREWKRKIPILDILNRRKKHDK